MTVAPAFKIWSGVYASFAEAPAEGPGFDGPIWRERSLAAARETMTQLETGEMLDYSLRQRNAVLPVLAAALLGRQSRVSVLDFGGGLGTGFMVLEKALGEAAKRVDYSVVEVGSICCAGEGLFAGKMGPAFHRDLPAAARFDIVHAASVMQYIENWQSVVARLADYGARFLLFEDMYIGDFQTYATLQNYYGSRIRHWCLNADEFVMQVETSGYKLALRTEAVSKILGIFGPPPMANFPAVLRVKSCCHLMFSLADGAAAENFVQRP
jgi:putative methyltransferase (TIGR04325 family)